MDDIHPAGAFLLILGCLLLIVIFIDSVSPRRR